MLNKKNNYKATSKRIQKKEKPNRQCKWRVKHHRSWQPRVAKPKRVEPLTMIMSTMIKKIYGKADSFQIDIKQKWKGQTAVPAFLLSRQPRAATLSHARVNARESLHLHQKDISRCRNHSKSFLKKNGRAKRGFEPRTSCKRVI